MDGVLNINKPSGVTSHDVVESVRKILHERRIGHTGTLDPLATGVLVLCAGRATRIAQYLEAGEKEYKAIMRLGVTTDTLDADGLIRETKSYTPPDRQKIIDVLPGFIGSIMQRPPAYSAVKVAGIPSYKLAREGKAELLKPRPVTIYTIELTAFEDPEVSLTVRCSKGVYIRTLCAELGEALGMGAHLTALERTRSGRFSIDRAITLDQLQAMMAAGNGEQALTPIDDALAAFPAIPISEAETVRVLHGNQISCPPSFAHITSDHVRLHSPAGRLLGLARIVEGVLKPDLVFS
ncbi:MAG: tRNA pseudouridine(55) synthase TruB [Nitrospirae bacterium]|nr:tRNA pseudouridine(55) synthase TruB [Nitrospirota bacterium]